MKKHLLGIALIFFATSLASAKEKALTCNVLDEGDSANEAKSVTVSPIGAETVGDCPLTVILRETKEHRALRSRTLHSITDHHHVFRMMDYTFDQILVRPTPEVLKTTCRYVTEEVYIEAITKNIHSKDKKYLICNPN